MPKFFLMRWETVFSRECQIELWIIPVCDRLRDIKIFQRIVIKPFLYPSHPDSRINMQH